MLIERGVYPHPWTGFLGYSITADLARRLRLPVEQGILVAQLYRGGPVDVAGLRGASGELVSGNRRYLVGGDIILAVDDQPVKDWTTFSA